MTENVIELKGLQKRFGIIEGVTDKSYITNSYHVHVTEDINAFDEEHLKPTLFMQSTHNTLSSAIAIRTGCYGYNITYSHGDASLQWAMRDAERLLETGKVKSVLVGSFDESTPIFSQFAERSGNIVPPDVYAEAVVLISE